MPKLTQNQIEVGMRFVLEKIDPILIMDANNPCHWDPGYQHNVSVGDEVEITRKPKKNIHGINLVYWKTQDGIEYASYWSTFKSCI